MSHNSAVLDEDRVERKLVFVGLVGMIDPPRNEAKEAVRLCGQGGIRVVMITGDHKLTAVTIARELGIMKNGTALTGEELDEINDEDLHKIIDHVSVYARVSPVLSKR